MTSRVKVLKRTVTSKFKDINDQKKELKQKKEIYADLSGRSVNEKKKIYLIDNTCNQFEEYNEKDKPYDPLDFCDLSPNYKLLNSHLGLNAKSDLLRDKDNFVNSKGKPNEVGSCCFCQKLRLLDCNLRTASPFQEFPTLDVQTKIKPFNVRSHTGRPHFDKSYSANDWFDIHAIPASIKLFSHLNPGGKIVSGQKTDSFSYSNLECCCPTCNSNTW